MPENISPVLTERTILGVVTGHVVDRAGEIPHAHNKAFRQLWYGATVTYDNLVDTELDNWSTEETGSAYYTETGNVGLTIHDPEYIVGNLVGVNGERVVAAVRVSSL